MTAEDALQSALAVDRPLEVHETFWASSVGSCVRKQIAQRAGLPPTNPPDFRVRVKFLVGNATHQALQKHLLTAGYLDPKYTSLDEKDQIVEHRWVYRCYSGRPDGVRLVNPACVEIKTVDDNSITRYDTPPEGYLWQGFLNCLALNLPTLEIFQLGRSQGLTKSREYPFTDEWRERLEREMAFMEDVWAKYTSDNILPPCQHRYPYEAKTCSYLQKES